jgi:hypothetical protein
LVGGFGVVAVGRVLLSFMGVYFLG